MEGKQLLAMDSYILLSLVNMKLRDEFANLKELCGTYEINEKEIKDKLKLVGYEYNESTNQFISL
ncbi:DUF4250 domain-containing protein [Clostridium bovifaecis]|uniref:DUF4250 domain-containing protein n=1 Tax=Clostridium bovifaecis TaxID=2184719 RepID=A0A6I6F4K3_9CLOT|nr:DUF4250 domain-containing protein [Clostridium bovifaecis]